MPLLVGRDVYDFVEKVKRFYYYEETWANYSRSGLEHVRKWFGKEKEYKQIDASLEFLFSHEK